MAVLRGLKVDASPLGWASFYHIGLRRGIIVHYHARRFRWGGYKLSVLLLYFGNVGFSREQLPKLYRVPYRPIIQHGLPIRHEIDQLSHEGDNWVRKEKRDARFRNGEGDAQVQNNNGDAWVQNDEEDAQVRNNVGDAQVRNNKGDAQVNCHAWSVSVASQHAENWESGRREFESD